MILNKQQLHQCSHVITKIHTCNEKVWNLCGPLGMVLVNIDYRPMVMTILHVVKQQVLDPNYV